MAVMVNPDFLPQILKQMDVQGLEWITEFDYRQPGRPVRMVHPHRAVKSRRPILLYGKPRCSLPEGSDVIEEPPRGESPKRSDTELLLEGLGALVQRLARPGQLVCDPVMLGEGDRGAVGEKAWVPVRWRCGNRLNHQENNGALGPCAGRADSGPRRFTGAVWL